MSVSDFRSLQATFVPRNDYPGQGRLYFWCMPPRRVDYTRKALSALGILRRGKSPPTGKLELTIPTPTRNTTEDWEIAELVGVRLPLMETIRGLVRIDLDDARSRRISDSMRAWTMAAKLAVELVARGHFVPLIDHNETGKPYARWAVASMTAETRERMALLEQMLPIAGHALVRNDGQDAEDAGEKKKSRRRKRKAVTSETSIWEPGVLLRAFLDAVADAATRDAAPSTSKDRPRKDNRELAPWELRWRYALTAADAAFESAGLVEQPLSEEVFRWAAPVSPRSNAGAAYVVAYQLERPGQSEESAEYPDAWYLRYLLQANDDPSLLVDAEQLWEAKGEPIALGDRTFLRGHEVLLESLAEIANIFSPCARSLYHSKPRGTLLTTEEAWDFISRVGPVLFQFGLGVRVPAELRQDGQQRLRLRLHVGSEAWDDQRPSRVGIDALTDFRWQVAVGEHDLSPEDFREIAALQKPLVQWRGQWMAVDPVAMNEMERLFDGADSTGTIDRPSALSAALAGNLVTEGSEIGVVAEGEIRHMIDALQRRDQLKPLPTPDTFIGELRHYQSNGLTWLSHMSDLGFGCCLADDMGLGKTIQVIAAFLYQTQEDTWGDGAALLVCPTSVIGNWERELRKFAPTLNVVRHHGRNRACNTREMEELALPGRIVLTTYVIARMDQDLLANVEWSHLILDEAQNIKNPRAQQARAIRRIPAERRYALTGTPVENRLTELWSILEFCNPGMLGTLGEFSRRFALPIERFGDAKAKKTLRRLVSPFILRRVKTDPDIIQDLPDKQEYKVYCTLTREQAALYQATVDDEMDKIESSKGVQRRGNILALLTRLKQICNHPTHFLKDESALPKRSGKLTRLCEMMEEVIAEGDHALIFTQYTKMGDLLVKHFDDTFGQDLPFIHGGVPVHKREEIVDNFQDDRDAPNALLLSIKAGGTGLNLTRATHVFHFDRWWNPAVEDQATDRAFRLGQTRNVQVHKMICSGTVEDKIDEILESKRGLADAIVGSGEGWITELDDTALRDLFALGKAAAVYDEEGV